MISHVPFLNRKDQCFMVLTGVCLLSTFILSAVSPGIPHLLYSTLCAGVLSDIAWHLEEIPIIWVQRGVVFWSILSIIFLVI